MAVAIWGGATDLAQALYDVRATRSAADTAAFVAKLRVYVKRPQDYPVIRKVCEKRCGTNLPVIYVVADVCRSDLLVEMEGLAFAKRTR